MPPKLALLAGIVFVGFVYHKVERSRETPVSAALFWPLLWFSITATHPLGSWLSLWGVPLPGGSDGEGSFIDRWFYLTLAIIGSRILARRKFSWSEVIRQNPILFALFAFMLVSAVWSQFPWISFKRFIKSIAALFMVMVVLTEDDPVEAIMAILRRCTIFFVPLSIVTIRYFRQIGVQFDWSGDGVSWTGLSTSKNTLGQIVMASALCLIWEIIRNRGRQKPWAWVDYVYLGMSLYLLKGSDHALSMTSLSVFLLGLLIFFAVWLLRDKLQKIPALFAMLCLPMLGILVLFVSHTVSPFSPDSMFGEIIRGMGRDITISGRTDIWSDILHIADQNALLGVGYGGFWIGRIANIPWNADMTWVLAEGHNGYIDAYLQIGAVGVCLLLGLIFSTIPRIARCFRDNFEYGRIRMTLFIVILFINLTESTLLRGDHALWFLFLLSVVDHPKSSEPLPVLPGAGEGDEETTCSEPALIAG